MESVELPSNIAAGGAFSRWTKAVDSATRGNFVQCYTCFIKAAAGEVSLSSKLGQWCWHLSAVLDAYNVAPGPDSPDGSVLLAKLRVANGEVPLTSPFGLWAQRVSLQYSTPNPLFR